MDKLNIAVAGLRFGSNVDEGFQHHPLPRTLQKVRVEVHLSNGTELGPTTPVDLGPGEQSDISLTATSVLFDTWSAHPEVDESGSGEHSGTDNG